MPPFKKSAKIQPDIGTVTRINQPNNQLVTKNQYLMWTYTGGCLIITGTATVSI
jgi:hypothetical protein